MSKNSAEPPMPLVRVRIDGKETKTARFNVIYTFAGGKQEICDVEVSADQDEKNLVLSFLAAADYPADLVKISTMKYHVQKDSDLEPFLRRRNGKYYFNTDVNNDQDTAYWAGFRDACRLGRKYAAKKGGSS